MAINKKTALKRQVLFCSVLMLLSARLWAAANPAELENISARISAVENDILAGDIRRVGDQLKKLRELISLQRKEIKLTEKKLSDLTEKLKSLSLQKVHLQGQIEESRMELHKSLKTLVLTSQEQIPQAFRVLDGMWMMGMGFVEAQNSYVLSITENRNKLMAALLEERNAVLDLETKIQKEKEKLEYYANDLKEKESSLLANEKFQISLMNNKKNVVQEEIKRMAKIKEIRDGEKKIQSTLEKLSAVEAAPLGLALLKGQLPWPVNGSVVSEYGRKYDPKTSLHTFQKGVSIESFGGSDVKAVAAGKVVYAGELRHYGTMVIVEHSGGYFTLYGRLGNVRVKEGQSVDSGAILGATSAEGSPLYFEIRNKNIALNPMQWFKQVSVGLNK